ncbi:hypothetical protein GQ53DRAFT_818617 [Thozetella sp. PMI_491]|nr:hypothetical protein GQ53DRAFT_818617 [Thozetella sp. PMI_491]
MSQTQEEAVLFKEFTELGQSDVADISTEIKLLAQIKDTLDESNIIRILFDNQQRVLKVLDAIVPSGNRLAERAERGTRAAPGLESDVAEPPEIGGRGREGHTDKLCDDQESDSGKDDVGSEIDEDRSSTAQWARPIWSSGKDYDEPSLPLAAGDHQCRGNQYHNRAGRKSRPSSYPIEVDIYHGLETEA